MTKILITGGAGFIGSNLAARLLENEENEVTILDNLFTGEKRNVINIFQNPRLMFVLHDVIEPFHGQFDYIYNLACPASPIHYQRNPIETIKTSFLGMLNVLELAYKTQARVLQASTSEIYGDPLMHPQQEEYWGNVNPNGIRSCYDEGKRIAETLCTDFIRQRKIDVRVIRIFNTYGRNMNPQDGRVVSNFIVKALKNEDIEIYGDGSQTRSFQYIDDLLDAMIAFMEKPELEVGKFFSRYNSILPILNIGNPEEYTIKELAEKILKMIPCRSKIIYKPLPQDDPRKRKPNIDRAKEFLDWQPRVKLDEGLVKTIKYFTFYKLN